MSPEVMFSGAGAGSDETTRGPTLYLKLFGGFALFDAHGAEIPISLRKGQGLIAYLALTAGQRASREHLAGIFWGDSAQQNARQSLRQLLFSLTRDLAQQPLSPLVVESQAVALRPGIVAVDAVQFRELTEADDPQSLDAALRLYDRELLEGYTVSSEAFEAWLSAERQQLAETARMAVQSAIAHRRDQGQHYQAITVCRTGLRLDPLNEALHRTLMELYIDNAMHSSALAQYRYCRGLLRSELGVEPDPETRRLYGRILSRSDHRDIALEAGASEPVSTEEPGPNLFLERDTLLHDVAARLAGEAGPPSHTLIRSARGFGKSELLKRVGVRFDECGTYRVLHLRGCRQERGLRFAPWMEVLGALAGASRDVQGDDDALPELRRMLDAGIDADRDTEASAHRIARSLGRLLSDLGRQKPTALLVDDAHALDPESQWLLGYCLRRGAALNLRALIAWNAEGDGFEVPEALDLPGSALEVVDLPALSSRAIGRIAEATLRSLGQDTRPELRREIEAVAEGNPMVARELAWTVVKAANDTQVGNTQKLDLRVPAQVHRHLSERLHPMRDAARALLEALAVATAPLDETQLAGVLDLEPDVLTAGLRDLTAAGLVRPGPDGNGVCLRRAYERRAVVETLTRVRENALHSRMAALLEEAGAEGEHERLRLAAHYEGAGEPAAACRAILAAARLARGRGAYREARRRCRKAAGLMAAIRPRSARTILSVERLLEEARLAELAQDDAKVAEYLEAAGEEVDVLPSSLLYRLSMARARNAAAGGDAVEGRRRFRHAIMLAGCQGRPIRPRAADRLLNQLHLIECTPDAFGRRLEETARDLRDRGQHLAECEVAGALALLLAARGRFPEAQEKIGAALALADSMGDEVLLAAALQWCGRIALWAADLPAADADLLRAAEIAEARGDLLRLQTAKTLRVSVLLARDEIGAAADCLEQARALAEDLDDAEGATMAAVAAAELAIARGDPTEAHAAVGRVLDDGSGFQRPWSQALGRRLLARVLLDGSGGAPGEAERAARHAVAEQEALGLKVDAARSLAVQARAHRAAGKLVQAAETYVEAARRLSSMGLASEAAEAETLAAALGTDTACARERQV